jgi:hypothetical protein
LLQYAKQLAHEEMKRLQGVITDDEDDDDDARNNKENISVDMCISLTEQLIQKIKKKV